jgi:putative ABC transport system ATP-binding protein
VLLKWAISTVFGVAQSLLRTKALGPSQRSCHGEFIAVTGPSGCGKTTFLTIAGMLDSFNEGEYELDGVNVYRMSDQERSWLRNEKIGFIFQSFNLIYDLTIRGRVLFGLVMMRVVRANEIPSQLMEVFGAIGIALVFCGDGQARGVDP